MPMTDDLRAKIDAAYRKCCDTNRAGSVGTCSALAAPCYDEDYLQARKEYHALLKEAGLMDPSYEDPLSAWVVQRREHRDGAR